MLNEEYSGLGVILKQVSLYLSDNYHNTYFIKYIIETYQVVSLRCLSDLQGSLVEGRMGLESTLDDYPGTGANKNHDPNPPGTP